MIFKTINYVDLFLKAHDCVYAINNPLEYLTHIYYNSDKAAISKSDPTPTKSQQGRPEVLTCARSHNSPSSYYFDLSSQRIDLWARTVSGRFPPFAYHFEALFMPHEVDSLNQIYKSILLVEYRQLLVWVNFRKWIVETDHKKKVQFNKDIVHYC